MAMNKEKMTRLNRTVFELWVGILMFGLILQLPVFLFPQKGAYTVCLWIGILAALLCAFHMWWALDKAMTNPEKATKTLGLHYALRYLFMILVLGGAGILYGPYVLVTFAALVGIKVAAYLQPVTKKLSTLVYGEEILPDIIENLDEYEEEQKLLKEQREGGE